MSIFDIPKSAGLNIPNISVPTIPTIKDQNLADEFHRRLMDYIISFENNLIEYEEVALRLVSFGESITIVVESIGYWNPSIISFVGTDTTGQRVQLIQHVTQLSFLLMAVKVPEPVEPRQRIGFRQKQEMENNKSQSNP